MNIPLRISPSRRLPVFTLSALLLAPCSLLFAQGGSLTPPGAPAPMMKTLQQIEPRTDIAELAGDATAVKVISAPGSYYLTGNLTGASGRDTIRVNNIAGRVTIDLGGFILSGTGTGRSAILLPAGNVRVTIRNGGIVASSDATTLAVGGSCSHVLCENLEITSNGAAAITLGTDGIVDRCRIVGGGITGLDRTIVRDSLISAAGINDVSLNIVGTDAKVTGVSFTVGRGQVAVGDRALVADCQINSGGHPTFLINATVLQTGVGAVVRDCTIAAGTTVGSAISVGNGTLLTGCRVTSTFRDGISSASSDNVTVESCVFQGFGRDGIKLNANARIRDCSVKGSGSNGGGIETGAGAVVTGCTVTNNGDVGISTGANSVIEKCSSSSNVSDGILTLDAATVTGCTASANGGIGIKAGLASNISHCSAISNLGINGINADFGSTIAHCTARANSNSGTISIGISLAGRGSVLNCTVTDTTNTNATPSSLTGAGISIGFASLVKDCVVENNKGDGILANGTSQIIGNTCDGNGFGPGIGAGIHTVSTRNRIEGNTVTGNDRGIEVDGTASLIIKNSAGGNTTNYDIVSSNRYGPIVDISAAGSAAVSGSSATSVLTTTDPNANFSH